MTKQTHTLSHKERQILVIVLVGIWAIIMCENWFFSSNSLLLQTLLSIVDTLFWLSCILILASLHTTKNQHQPIFMGLGVKKLTNCRNTALSLFNNTKRKPSINKSKPNANKLA